MRKDHYSADEIPAVMDVPELGRLLNIGRNNAYNLVRSGKIRPLPIGRKIRIARHEVLRFLGEDEP